MSTCQLVMEFHFDVMSCSKSGNEKFWCDLYQMFTVAAGPLPLVYAQHEYTYQRLGDFPCVHLFYAHLFKKDRTP